MAGEGVLLTSACPVFVLREQHCENTSLQAPSLCQRTEACPSSKNRLRSHWAKDNKGEELQGEAEMQLLSMPTSGWYHTGCGSFVFFLMMWKCPEMQTFPFHNSSFPSCFSVQINYIQLQLWCQVADWLLQFQYFDKWEKKKKWGDLIGLFEVLKLFFITHPLELVSEKRRKGRFAI